MKYLKRYNEELHLNPLQFGKTKINLQGGSTIYGPAKAKLDEESKKIIIADCLKLITRDLGTGWQFSHYLNNNYPPYWNNSNKLFFTKENYAILIIFGDSYEGRNVTGSDFSDFNYQYFYHLDLDLISHINEKAAPRKLNYQGPLKSLTQINSYLATIKLSKASGKFTDDNYFLVDNSNSKYWRFEKKFKDFPPVNLDLDHLQELVRAYQQELKEIAASQNEKDENVEQIKSIYPQLMLELGEAITELKDFTSFSEEIYTKDTNDDIFHHPIVTLKLHWEKLKKDICLTAAELNDWDYLLELTKHFKQIDARVHYLNTEYFNNTGYSLELLVDLKSSWTLEIRINGSFTTDEEDDDYDRDA